MEFDRNLRALMCSPGISDASFRAGVIVLAYSSAEDLIYAPLAHVAWRLGMTEDQAASAVPAALKECGIFNSVEILAETPSLKVRALVTSIGPMHD